LLAVLLERVRPSRLLQELVVATTLRREDDPVADLCQRLGVACFRGSEEDCLDRCYQAAVRHGAEVVVRLTGDNPLVEAEFVDEIVAEFLAADPPLDYADTTASRTFPLGLSVEVCTAAALAQAWREDADPRWREHVTPFLYRHPERFRIRHLAGAADGAALRWTVDTPEDLAAVRRVFAHFGRARFGWREAAAAQAQHPEWTALNAHVPQRRIEHPAEAPR
jgi:spore coat polysaccharide biosynthesis protein SpsF